LAALPYAGTQAKEISYRTCLSSIGHTIWDAGVRPRT